jgi:sulfite reductase alpha subunit-like flavoprotein
MISNGTGLSPFRPLIKEFGRQREIWLIHGCRYIDDERQDFIYRDELEPFLNQLTIVTSRQGECKYVQNALDSEEIKKWNPGCVLICGNLPYGEVKAKIESSIQVITEEWIAKL